MYLYTLLVVALSFSFYECTNHRPRFANTILVVPTEEGIPAGTTIAIIQATDPDNDVITYSLGDAANGFFTINKNTGELMPATVLDREKHVRKL